MKFLFSVFCASVFVGFVFAPTMAAAVATTQDSTAVQGNSITFIEADTTTTLRLDGQTPTILAYVAAGRETITVTARALGEGTIEGLEGTYTLDPVIEILSPEGERLAYNDDHRTTLEHLTPTDAAIERLFLPEPATYTLRVNTFNGVTAGDVEVLLALVSPVEYEIVTDEADTLIMTVSLEAAQTFQYRFAAEAGTVYTIVARDLKGLLDPIITLRESDTENTIISAEGVFASNDDFHYRFGDAFILNVFDARIIDAEIPQDGDYVLELREFMGRGGAITVQMVARKP